MSRHLHLELQGRDKNLFYYKELCVQFYRAGLGRLLKKL